MPSPESTSVFAESLAAVVQKYRHAGDPVELAHRLSHLAGAATPDAVVAAAEPYRDDPDVMAPLYERVVAEQPTNARALVILANAFWLQGRGPEVVGQLASRAIESDPANRAAWHLWALSESDPRERVLRWQQVSERFPDDLLAVANVADNASAVAGAESDYDMLDLAVQSYERLLERSEAKEQREAVETALRALKGWRF
ncbi:MAG: hypothetical protein U0132_08160 [Gemmatimonadaceae bacterium]